MKTLYAVYTKAVAQAIIVKSTVAEHRTRYYTWVNTVIS